MRSPTLCRSRNLGAPLLHEAVMRMASNSAARRSTSMCRVSLSISSLRLRFKYSLASSDNYASMGMVKSLNVAWSCKASAFFRLATAICCVAWAYACNVNSLFASNNAVDFAALFPCRRGGRLKNPSHVSTSTLDPWPVPSGSHSASPAPLLLPCIATSPGLFHSSPLLSFSHGRCVVVDATVPLLDL